LGKCQILTHSLQVIYGLPVQPSRIQRLATLGKTFGKRSISVLVDSTDALSFLGRYHELTGYSLGVYVKLDTGSNRAGLLPDSQQLRDLLTAIQIMERDHPSDICLFGFYSHMGSSYGSDNISEALDYLAKEIGSCEMAAILASEILENPGRRFIISVGATPTATSAQILVPPTADTAAVQRVKELIKRVQCSHDIELHAGAYVLLDMQQLAAHARPGPRTWRSRTWP
jgi:D-serine deaminase-like pyridoxal phosphate-dependent protein